MYQVPPHYQPNPSQPAPISIVLRQAIDLLRQFPGVFFALAAIQVLPVLAFNVYAQLSGVSSRATVQINDLLAELQQQVNASGGDPSLLTGFPWSMPVADIRTLLFINLVSLLVGSFLLSALARAATVVAVGDAHASTPTATAALRTVVSRLPQLLAWGLLSFIGTLGLCMLLLIPCLGIILVAVTLLVLWVRLVFVIQIIVAEQAGVVEAMRRSWVLTKGAFGRIFLSLLVFVVVVSIVISLGTTILNAIVALLLGTSSLALALSQTILTLGQLLGLPITMIGVTMVYYDQRRLLAFTPQPPPSTVYPPYQ